MLPAWYMKATVKMEKADMSQYCILELCPLHYKAHNNLSSDREWLRKKHEFHKKLAVHV